VDVQPPLHPIHELLAALGAAKIRFLVVGGTAAVLHGAPIATVDTDIWVDLSVRQYVRILEIGKRLGAAILSGNVLGLRDDHRVDFLYRIDGLSSFATEWKRAEKMVWAGVSVKVLPLARVIRSKEISNRPKDLIQLPALRDYLACKKVARLKRSGYSGRSKRKNGR
jgi:hypothetical protein